MYIFSRKKPAENIDSLKEIKDNNVRTPFFTSNNNIPPLFLKGYSCIGLRRRVYQIWRCL
jgi:hypothetical protein